VGSDSLIAKIGAKVGIAWLEYPGVETALEVEHHGLGELARSTCEQVEAEAELARAEQTLE
jgi:hypothetical protein